jgi:voltage-gated potassium channel
VHLKVPIPTLAQVRALTRDDASTRQVEQWFHFPIVVAALIAIPAIAVQLTVEHGWMLVLANVVGWIVWSVFVLELVFGLRTATHPARWLVTHPIELLVVVLTPPFLGELLLSMPYLGALLRLLLLLRVVLPILRLRKLITLSGVVYGCVFCLLMLVACGLAYPIVEPAARHAGADDGLWWAWMTSTTVGYGDIYPVTSAGRMLAGFTVLVGIRFVSLFTAIVVESLVASRVGAALERDVEQVERDVAMVEAGVDTATDQVLATLRRIEHRLEALESQVTRS